MMKFEIRITKFIKIIKCKGLNHVASTSLFFCGSFLEGDGYCCAAKILFLDESLEP